MHAIDKPKFIIKKVSIFFISIHKQTAKLQFLKYEGKSMRYAFFLRVCIKN